MKGRVVFCIPIPEISGNGKLLLLPFPPVENAHGHHSGILAIISLLEKEGMNKSKEQVSKRESIIINASYAQNSVFKSSIFPHKMSISVWIE